MDHSIEGAKDLHPCSAMFYEVVREFLHEFQHHESDIRIDMPGILRYRTGRCKQRQGRSSDLNVMFKSNSQKGTDPFNFEGNVGSVQTIVRAKLRAYRMPTSEAWSIKRPSLRLRPRTSLSQVPR